MRVQSVVSGPRHRLVIVHWSLVIPLLLCLFLQAMAHARSSSLTFDEGPHLATGYATLRTGDLRLQPVHIHPPLANVLAAAPLLLQRDLPDPRAVEGWEIASLSAITDAVVWQYPHPRRLALAGRFPIILMTLLLAAIVFRWARDLGQIGESANRQIGRSGVWAGMLALFLYAFDPNIIAHGSLVTTDMAVVLWGTLALFLTWRYLRGSHVGATTRVALGGHKTRPYAMGAAVALGLALGSKVSALSLAPVLGLLWLVGPRGLSWQRRLLTAAGGAVLAALTLWALYGFEVRTLPGFPFPLPVATHISIYRSLQEHYSLGHPAFLLGQNSDHGWWYYFPVAFVLKTPLPTLLLLGAATILGISKSASQQINNPPTSNFQLLISNLQPPIRRWGPLVLFPVIYVASTPFSSVNIGYRHLLPILPFVFIVASRITQHGTRNTRHALRIACSVFCLAWLAFGALLASPNYLAYFNVPDGYRYLVDSNLDWGQNLWQLRDWMHANSVERITYAHFSPARPEVYGIQADLLPPSPRAVSLTPLEPAPGVYAIGATVLQGVYTPDVNTFAWFRTHEPLARLGHALFVYRVESRPAPSWAALCADLAPVLPPGAVQAGFGQPEMRVIVLDCAQAWVYPAGEEPGTFVLSPEMEAPPGATLEVAARYADGKPFYNVYRVEEPLAPEQTANVLVDGPLDFLGYRASPAVYAGETTELWTFWRVRERPTRPLSLMAHLVGPDGVPIAVGDGLGAPVEQWQPGDVIVQRHRLEVPLETVSDLYPIQIGAYWLDTRERWPMRDGEGNVRDHVTLAEIGVLR